MKIELGYSGSSVLVALITLEPGENGAYEQALESIVPTWARQVSRTQQSSHKQQGKSNPYHFHQPMGYLGLGNWNYITLTILGESGFATRLAYAGNAVGQHFFYANDLHLVFPGMLDDNEIVPDSDFLNLRELCEQMAVSYTLKVDQTVVKNQLNKSLNQIVVGEHTASLETETHAFFSFNKPLHIRHIDSGKNFGLGTDNITPTELVKEFRCPSYLKYPDPQQGNSNSLDKIKNNHLLGLFHLKINPLIKTGNPIKSKAIFFISLLHILHTETSTHCISERPFVKLFSVDGFYDCLIMFRGYFIQHMEEIVQKIRSIKVKTLHETLGKLFGDNWHEIFGVSNNWGKSNLGAFSISYSVYGVPPSPFPEFYNKLYTENGGNDENDTLKKFKDRLRVYNPSSPTNKSHLVEPVTLLSIDACKLDEAMETLDEWRKKMKELGISTEVQPKVLSGRFDIQVFGGGQKLCFGDFLLAHQVCKWMLLGRDYHRQRSGEPPSIRVRRLRSRLKEIKTKFVFPFQPNPSTPSRPRNRFHQLPSSSLVASGWILDRVTTLHKEIKGIQSFGEACFGFERGVYGVAHNEVIASKKREYFHNHIATGIQTRVASTEQFFRNYDNTIENDLEKLHEFLVLKLGQDISSETVHSFFITISAFEHITQDPLVFYYFIDVKKYLENLFDQLFSAYGFMRKDKYYLFYFNRETKKILQIPQKEHSDYAGIEAWLSSVCTTIQRVIGQRKAGIYPNHDRNFSRLSDLQVFHSKKIIGISWLINDLVQKTTQNIPALLEKHLTDNSKSGPDSNTQNNVLLQLRLAAFPKTIPRILSFYSNAPDMFFFFPENAVGINSTFLSNTEGMAFTVHEVGHIIARAFDIENRHYHENKFKLGFPHRNEKSAKDILGLKRVEILTAFSEYFSSKKIKIIKKIKSITLAKCLLNDTIIWEEVLADLMAYKIAFPSLCDKIQLNTDHAEKPIGDLFVLAWWFQLFKLPGSSSIEAFKKELLRMAIVHATIHQAHHSYNDKSLLDALYHFGTEHFKNFLDFLCGSVLDMFLQIYELEMESNPTGSNFYFRHKFWLGFYFNLSQMEGANISKSQKERIKQNVDRGGNDPFYLTNEDLTALSEFLDVFPLAFAGFMSALWQDKYSEPLLLFLDFLSRQDQACPTNPYFQKREPRRSAQAAVLGFIDGQHLLEDKDQNFALALELAGDIFLNYITKDHSLNFESDRFLLTQGFLGFKDHEEQQSLARRRKLIASLIWEGFLSKID